MNEIIYGIAVIPLIIGLVQALKQVGLPDQFAPLASIGLGLALAIAQILTGAEMTPLAVVLNGIAYGLAASGLYSGARAVTNG